MDQHTLQLPALAAATTTPNIGDHVITPSHELTRASSNPIPESPESKCKPPKDTNGQTSGPEDEQLKTPGYYDSSLVKQRKHFGTSEQKKKSPIERILLR